jgi:hypothetical protein
MNSLPPVVRRTLGWQIIAAVVMGPISGLSALDVLTNPKTRARPDFETFCWFMVVIGYWAVAAALSALLIWKRKRAGLYLAWTVLPGILRTAPGLLSQEMREYLDGQV